MIHRLPIPTPFRVGPVNAYLVDDDPLTLVDVGDQVAVDPADPERRGDRQAMDHERISVSSSSRRRSMSSWEIRLSRFSRRSGSVLEGRTLKCQSS